MTIDINPETDRVVREELRKGHFESVDDLILTSIQAWRQRSSTEDEQRIHAAVVTERADGREKARQFVQWAKSHPDTPALSDEAVSRSSLNPDRW